MSFVRYRDKFGYERGIVEALQWILHQTDLFHGGRMHFVMFSRQWIGLGFFAVFQYWSRCPSLEIFCS